MRYQIFEIEPGLSYGITIGSRQKPDSRLKEYVKTTIDTAMASFEREPESVHRVAVVPDYDPDHPGSDTPVDIQTHRQYLIFALLRSEPGVEEPTEQELAGYQAEIGEMIAGTFGNIAAAIVLLVNCSVTVLPVNRVWWNPSESTGSVVIPPRDSWD